MGIVELSEQPISDRVVSLYQEPSNIVQDSAALTSGTGIEGKNVGAVDEVHKRNI